MIGEPGAGKSAVINALGRALSGQGHDVVELAVDRFSVESLEGLSRALRLVHELPDVLGAWDGSGSGFVLIDALDTSRGGPGEAAFKRLIEAVIELNGRWSVVASIRTFDLRLGQNFRTLFKGTPPEAASRLRASLQFGMSRFPRGLSRNSTNFWTYRRTLLQCSAIARRSFANWPWCRSTRGSSPI